jgi:cytochrome c-type biogenesis protein CcmH/NrfF
MFRLEALTQGASDKYRLVRQVLPSGEVQIITKHRTSQEAVMKQPRGSYQQSSPAVNASPKMMTRFRKLWSLIATAVVLMLCMGAGDTTEARYNGLGHRIMCACYGERIAMGPSGACGQVLLECNHLGCNTSGRMRSELRAALDKGDKDDVVLHWFVQKYGTNVLVEPSIINRLVWITAFAVVAILSLVIILLRRRQPNSSAVATPTSLSGLNDVDVEMLRRRVRAQTENDDW